jgi:hypothetical protein
LIGKQQHKREKGLILVDLARLSRFYVRTMYASSRKAVSGTIWYLIRKENGYGQRLGRREAFCTSFRTLGRRTSFRTWADSFRTWVDEPDSGLPGVGLSLVPISRIA